MYYRSFWILNRVLNLFGLAKPWKPQKLNALFKIWSLLIVATLITTYFITVKTQITFSLKLNFGQMSDLNDLFVNACIVLINLMQSDKTCLLLYDILNSVLVTMKIEARTLDILAVKLFIWFGVPALLFLTLIILEIVQCSSFSHLIRISMFLTMLHLYIHISLILAVLKKLNSYLIKALTFEQINEGKVGKQRTIIYVLNPAINFPEIDCQEYFDLKSLCNIYGDLSTCMTLLENLHGFQMLLSIWLMFATAVVGMSLVVCNQATVLWLVLAMTALPFSWLFIGCYLDDQLQNEVEIIKTTIIKYLIDYRCDSARRISLETFKLLVATNNLKFSAFGLFRLNYSMLFATVLNVITYSIILIQLFLSQ